MKKPLEEAANRIVWTWKLSCPTYKRWCKVLELLGLYSSVPGYLSHHCTCLKGRDCCLHHCPWSWCLAHSRCTRNVCWINPWMGGWKRTGVPALFLAASALLAFLKAQRTVPVWRGESRCTPLCKNQFIKEPHGIWEECLRTNQWKASTHTEGTSFSWLWGFHTLYLFHSL